MYRTTELRESFKNLVGWKQDYDPAHALDADLLQSESGLYFQTAHPLLTLSNIREAMPENLYFQYPIWIAGTYAVGDKVRVANKVYTNTVPANTATPGGTDTTWKEYRLISDYLREAVSEGIDTVVHRFLQEKTIESASKQLLDRRTFFDGVGRLSNVVQTRQKLVGFDLAVKKSMGITVKLNRVGFQFVGGPCIFRVNLQHSESILPPRTLQISYTGNGGMQWFNLPEWYAPYVSQITNSGGYWYLYYDQAELPAGVQAVNSGQNWELAPCSTCNATFVETHRERSKYFTAMPFFASALDDRAEIIHTSGTSYGMNAEFSVHCDLTDFITSQKHIFASVLQKQVAATLLRTVALNPDVRVNRNQSNVSRMDLLYELDGNSEAEHRTGLNYELAQAYKALSLDTYHLDHVCLGGKKTGVKYKSL